MRCPADAVMLHTDKEGKDYVEINAERCIGCGICVRFCPTNALVMERRKERAFVPVDSFERFILGAIDTGTLQNLLLDNYTLLTHDILRRFLKIILSFEPAKRLLAQRQLRSRFLAILTKTEHYTLFDKLFNDGRKPDYSHPELAKDK
jgi:ferredoxin